MILVFGDSLSAAYGIPPASGWVALLQRKIREQGLPHRVVNASISGETTRGGLARIESALAQHKPALVIVELGGNDGLRGLPLEATRANLDGILRACRQKHAQVLLVGMDLPPNYGRGYAEKFRAIYSDLAKKHRIPLVPFLLEGFADKPEYFQADGIHPTAAAQRLILDTVWKGLQPLLKRWRQRG